MNIILQQMLEQIIISFLLIGWGHSLSTLTYNNCPQEFAPAFYNTSLVTTTKNLAASIYGGLFSSQAQAAIQASFNSGDLQAAQKQVTSTSFLLPFILAGSIFAGLLLCAACCCTFDRRCPPCESWRRNYVKEPYSRLQLSATMIAAVVFSVGILVATIVAFSTFGDLSTDLRMTKCGLYYSLDTALNGDQTNNWGGFAQIQMQVQNTSALLGAAATSINSNLLGNEWIISGMQTLQDMNLALYSDNQNSVIATPNPVDTAAANLAGTAPPTIVPLFIQTKLGPNGTAGTMVSDIDSGLQVTQRLSAQAYTTYVSAVGLANSAQNITANTNSNLQSISIASKYLSNIQISIQAFTKNFLDVALNPGIYLLQAVFGVILLATLLSLLGIISSHLFGLYGCRQMVHGGWVLLGCFYFAVLGILFVLLAVGGVSYTFCQYFQSIISSNAGYVSFATASSTSNFNKFFTYLDVCFFQDGNILKKFELSQEMKAVSDVFLNTQTYLNMQTSGNTQYVDITIAPAKIITWMNTMNNYSLGVINDALASDLTQNNPYVSLAHLNLRTNQNSTGVNTTCANDYWVFDSSQCTFGPSQSQYSPSANISTGLYIPPTGTLCISLNTRISQSAPSIWTASDIAQRYLAVRSCKTNSSSAYDEILSYAEALTNYRDSRINLYKSLSDQLSSLLTVINAYNTNMTTFTGSLSTFFSAVSTLNNVVTNQINGLTISSNCTIIANSMRFFYNMYCVNLLNRSVKIVICCGALLFLIVGAVLLGSLFGLRYSRVEKQKRFVGEDAENEVFKDDVDASLSSSNSQDSH